MAAPTNLRLFPARYGRNSLSYYFIYVFCATEKGIQGKAQGENVSNI
jgi:hypothetical protein